MSKDLKAVFLGILTTLVYMGSIWMDKGVFLYPFPLNEFIFAIVSFQIIRLNAKSAPLTALLSGTTAVFFLFSSPYFWTFFLSSTGLSNFVEGIYFELLKLGFYALLLFWMFNTIVEIKGVSKYICFAFLTPLFILHPMYSMPLSEVIGVSIVAIISSVNGIQKPFHLLWVLLAYLTTMKYLLFYFN